MLSGLLKPRPAGLVLAWLAALLVVAWLVYAGRDAAFERGRRSTEAFAAVVEQEVARTFQAVFLTLGAVGDVYQIGGPPKKNDPDFQRMMVRRLGDLPFVRALFIIGPDGWITHDTDYPGTPAVSLADRPYFRAYASNPSREQAVWPPLLSRSGTGWFLPLTRALGGAGDFQGVMVAALQAAHFHQGFRAMQLPEGYLIALLHADGTFVASYPATGVRVGASYRELAGKRLVSYRAVSGAPFVVRVSRGEEDILAEWRRTATGAALAMSALTLFIGWTVARLARESGRRARERERRAQAEKMEALGQLSAGMAHDFANLLNVVGMNVALIRQQPLDRAGTERALAAIERAVGGGGRVAQRLLAFARRTPLALTRVRLDAWLEAARPLIAQAAGPRVSLTAECATPMPEILCDVSELDVALVNLVLNARDAMGGAGSISVRAYPCDEESGAPQAFIARPVRFVCLTVKDDGPGMTEAVRRRALEPFYTTKGESGTGLGLPQVYGFMQQLGGQLSIESEPGRGTAVHLFFPVTEGRDRP
jgi:signal transduction histidine kinase